MHKNTLESDRKKTNALEKHNETEFLASKENMDMFEAANLVLLINFK